jgi:hypothetical protein
MSDRTPEQMMADALRRIQRPEDAEDREQLALKLEAFGKRLVSLHGGWWNLPDGMRRRLRQERTDLLHTAHALLLPGRDTE